MMISAEKRSTWGSRSGVMKIANYIDHSHLELGHIEAKLEGVLCKHHVVVDARRVQGDRHEELDRLEQLHRLRLEGLLSEGGERLGDRFFGVHLGGRTWLDLFMFSIFIKTKVLLRCSQHPTHLSIKIVTKIKDILLTSS